MSTPTAEELRTKARQACADYESEVGYLAQRLADALAEVAQEREAYDTLTLLLRSRFPVGSDFKVEDVLRENIELRAEVERLNATLDAAADERQAIAIELIELRQRAEASEAKYQRLYDEKVEIVGKLAEAQQREVWWREWYELGEKAVKAGGADITTVLRAKELRALLGLVEGGGE